MRTAPIFRGRSTGRDLVPGKRSPARPQISTGVWSVGEHPKRVWPRKGCTSVKPRRIAPANEIVLVQFKQPEHKTVASLALTDLGEDDQIN
jgi:hypothetical protein